MTSPRPFLVLAALGAVIVTSRAGGAQEVVPPPPALKPFAPVLQRYVDGYIRRRGEAGLRPLATADFVWFTHADHAAVRGKEAVAKAAQELGFVAPVKSEPDGTRYYRSLSVSCTAPRLEKGGKKATLYTRLNYGYITLKKDSGLGSTAIGLYKQTWAKTPQGWRLAAMELDTRSDASPVTYYPVAKGDEQTLSTRKP